MTMTVEAAWLQRLADLVVQHWGLHFPAERWPDLMRGLRAAASEMGSEDVEDFAHMLLGHSPDTASLQALADALTVGETYFFRERRSFEVLAGEILPPLIAQRQAGSRRLRFWSAGCCTGEEAYSLAILLDRMLPRHEGWQVSILATDVNRRFLNAAARAEYGEWSFRDAPAWLKSGYFTRNGTGGHALLPRIRRMVRFAPLNLADLQFPQVLNGTEAMDVILCRNVLMYLAPDLMRQVCQRFECALVDGGWLSVSATELGPHAALSFAPVHFDDAVFYRKAGVRQGTARLADHAPPRSAAPERPMASRIITPLPAAPGVHPQPPRPPLQAEPASAERLARLARALADAGQLGPAREAIEHALTLQRMDAGMHHLHASILLEMGEAELAGPALRRALYLEPDFVIAHHAIGQLALREGRHEQGMRHLRNAHELLDRVGADVVLPHSDGLAAGRLKALLEATLQEHSGR
jgi:chemotaxis protein methyltransferase CheR